MGTDITTITVIIPMVRPPDGISESAAEKSCLTSKNRHNGKEKHSVHLTKATWLWVLFMFGIFVSIQVYSIFLSFLVEERGLGTAADSGLGWHSSLSAA